MKITKKQNNLQIFKALADKARLDMIMLLSSGPQCVCNMYEKIGLKQSITSHHLRVLRESGLVEINKDGKWIYYSLNRKNIVNLQNFIEKIILTKENNFKC